MLSITFKTNSGTEIEVRNINTAATVDVIQAIALVLDEVEANFLAGDYEKCEGQIFGANLMGGGSVGVAFPPAPEDEDDFDEGDAYENGVNGVGPLQTQDASPNSVSLGVPGSLAPEGYYVCPNCGGTHPTLETLDKMLQNR